MNSQIANQLSKCRVADIPTTDSTTTTIVLNKQDKPRESGMAVGKCYSITVEDYIVTPFSGFTLHDNWNQGIAPTDKDMRVEVLQTMGKMVKLEAIGINDGKSWTGWIPVKSIQINEELK